MFSNKQITVKKIDNGYVVEACCDGKEQAEYIKKLSKVPSILARWFGESNKSPEEYDRMNRVVTESKGEGSKINVEMKLTND